MCNISHAIIKILPDLTTYWTYMLYFVNKIEKKNTHVLIAASSWQRNSLNLPRTKGEVYESCHLRLVSSQQTTLLPYFHSQKNLQFFILPQGKALPKMSLCIPSWGSIYLMEILTNMLFFLLSIMA